MPTYCHSLDPDELLIQLNPPHSLDLFYPDDRATESIEGFLRDGGKQRSYILESLRLSGRTFQWFAGLSHETILSPEKINLAWRTFTNRTRRYYDRNLAFFWVREPTPSDPRRLHYHLAILDDFLDNPDDLHKVLKTCLSRFPDHHLWIRPAKPAFYDLTYMLKLGGCDEDEILLFKPGLKLRRHGVAGHFHPEGIKKRALVSRVNSREHRISEGASMLGHPELIHHISRFLQIPVGKVRRLVGEDPYNPVWESWMDSMRRSSPY
jgi:hypothetical protein